MNPSTFSQIIASPTIEEESEEMSESGYTENEKLPVPS
jgi:hypothetical protein